MDFLFDKILNLRLGFLILSAFLFQFVSAQNVDTIKINLSHQVYDTVKVYDTIVKYDTVWIESKLKEIRLSASASGFLCTWRKYNDLISVQVNQRNFSAGLSVDFVFSKFAFSPGLFFTQFNEARKFGYSITELDSLINIQLVPQTYFIYDTTGVSLQILFHDSTYFDNGLMDSVTIVVADSVTTYQIDTTQVNYNDTVYSTVYDTIRNDTILARNFKYTYLEIPLILKYRIGEYKNFGFDVGTGFIAGFLIKSESYFFDVGENAVRAYAKTDTYKFLPSLWFSVGVSYSIGNKFLIRLEPYYNPGLRSIYKKTLPVIKIPDRYGLKFGLTYCF